jgi:predicted nucleotidyltransferase component of viral defense system
VIPRADIIAWRNSGFAWQSDAMVEQDLLISRMLVGIFSNPFLRENLVFRGGTALHKLFLNMPYRYSEDIDLVQRRPAPIGPIFDAVRETAGGWLDTKPSRKQGRDVVNMIYRLESEDTPPQPLRIKIEINTREHTSFAPLSTCPFNVESRWFSGRAEIVVYSLEELLATKLRALYQRRKGRDLFDLAIVLRELDPSPAGVVQLFQKSMDLDQQCVTREQFCENLAAKLDHSGFATDCHPLLRPGVEFDLRADANLIEGQLLEMLDSPESLAR